VGLASLLFAVFLGEFEMKQQHLPAVATCLVMLLFTNMRAAEPNWVESEIADLHQAHSLGAKYAIVTFSIHRLLWHSDSPEALNQDAVSDYQKWITAAESLGMTVIGTAPTWVLPPFANPPLKPSVVPPALQSAAIPEARLAAIPAPGSDEYLRLAGIRNRMWGTFARTFPKVTLWMVGYEPGFEFYDTSGQQLIGADLQRYMVDTLEGINLSTKSANAKARIIAHFLGRSGMPIRLRGEIIAAQDIVDLITTEINRRSKSAALFFDQFAFDIEPTLLGPRLVDFPTLATEQTPYDCMKTHCYSTAEWNNPGWNIKCCEPFAAAATDITTDADYRQPSGNQEWNEILAPTFLKTDISVQQGDGRALLRLQPSGGPDPNATVAAGVSAPGMQVVPMSEFRSQGTDPGDERNRWTAIMDFYPVLDPLQWSSHAAAMVRVNDRNYSGFDTHTRFGATAYRGPVNQPVCVGEPGCGALQFSGDSKSQSGTGAQYLFWFKMDHALWSHPDTLYRVQTIEREWFHPLSFVWEPWWRAEVWSLTGSTCIGYHDFVGQWTLENLYDIQVPELSGSKILFAQSEGQQGGINAEQVGTAYWVY
jgi:hypothetical protein